MSVPVAIAFGVAAATVYGVSIVFQHDAVHDAAGTRDGQPDAQGLLQSVRSPQWLLAIAGDFVGFLLQIAALAAGPVVLVQPLVVLMLPVALAVGVIVGGPRPSAGDYLGCAALVGGLIGFLLLIGDPSEERVPHSDRIATFVVVVLVAGVVACLVTSRGGALLRGAMVGAVAGAYFGTLGVLVDGASDQVSRFGVHGLVGTHRGLTILIGIAVLGLGGIVLTQVSFQIGKLAATLPANLSVDPLTAVVLGAVLLGEHLPVGPAHLVGYLLCLAAVVGGTIRLAKPATAEHHLHHSDADPAGPARRA